MKDVRRHMDSKKHQNKEVGNDTIQLYHCPVKKCRFAKEGMARRDNFVRHMRTQHAISVKGRRGEYGNAKRAELEDN